MPVKEIKAGQLIKRNMPIIGKRFLVKRKRRKRSNKMNWNKFLKNEIVHLYIGTIILIILIVLNK
jgi:hypothetical protein